MEPFGQKKIQGKGGRSQENTNKGIAFGGAIKKLCLPSKGEGGGAGVPLGLRKRGVARKGWKIPKIHQLRGKSKKKCWMKKEKRSQTW